MMGMTDGNAASGLFRNRAAKAAEYRWFSPVLIITPPAVFPACVLAAAAVACLLAALMIIEVPERIRATGVLMPSQGLLKVRAWRSGQVTNLSVANGEMVTEGQPLMWLTDEQQAPQSEPESVERLASLRRELRLMETTLEQDVMAAESRTRLNRRRKELLEKRLGVAEAEHVTRQQQTGLQEGRAQRVSKLAAEGIVAAQSADELQASALQARALGQVARQQVLALQDEVAQLTAELQRDAVAPLSLRTHAGIRRQQLLREIAAVAVRSAGELSAPGNGIVAGLSVRVGSFVQSGQTILTIHDNAEPVEARLYVSADNAAMISRGQRVELQLRAYPHELFGTQSAIVTMVSATALSAGDLDIATRFSGSVFEIRAALETTSIAARGAAWPLPPGTAFDADLVRRRWPLYRWLWRSGGAADKPHA